MANESAINAQAIGQVTVDTDAAAASIITLAAAEGVRHVIRNIMWGYSTNAAPETLSRAIPSCRRAHGRT